MRITTKGQVTIPQAIREAAGLLPHTEVEFVMDGLVIFIHHFDGSKPARIRHVAHRQAREHVQQFEVAIDDRLDAGAQHFDDDALAVGQRGTMRLPQRRSGDGLIVDRLEYGRKRLAQFGFEHGADRIEWLDRDFVLQAGQLAGDLVIADDFTDHYSVPAAVTTGR